MLQHAALSRLFIMLCHMEYQSLEGASRNDPVALRIKLCMDCVWTVSRLCTTINGKP
jgi:hypothetical protein